MSRRDAAALPQSGDPRPAPAPTHDELATRLAAIVESSDDAIISNDLNGTITSWNPAAVRMFGYTAAEVLGKSIRIIIPEARQAEEDEVLCRIMAGEAVDHFETVRRRKNGSEVVVSLTESPAPEDVATLVRDACESFRAKSEDKLMAFQCEIAAGTPMVAADRHRVQQVLSNLVGNAFKFTPEGGTITVLAQPVERFVRFSVGDTGPGIRAEDLSHIFERYWQSTRTATLGTGLGLTIAKGIVDAHGGSIWVDSTPGVGATFYFTLPTAAAGAGDAETRSSTPA